ncbi:DUF4202 domain-containing protein [Gilvimarinus sp. F26214L]|uniref:DUF4202 domain-containing protein n=1 Tax=Gilvimarinus sp. DZF01 TaxID=3461371 RepID=UPI004045CA06
MTDQLTQVIRAIDQANQEDPNREFADGREWPKEYLYSLRMTRELQNFAPGAGEVLRIAARAQHIRRWNIPRDSFPRNRPGYLQWRRELGRFHGEQTALLMREAGYDRDSIARCRAMLAKTSLRQDPDAQTLEDLACLVFLRYHLADFAEQHREEKLRSIIRKTWNKMSPPARTAAMTIEFSKALRILLDSTLSDSAR